MKKINRLSKQLIEKIAAGEVIERPAYAVKELVENAIDAQADFIEIQVEESGLRRITVTDNGQGMSKEDLEICFLPHTTSKLKPDDELIGIKTLGFRGEALSAIAAVSHMTIITRTPKDVGGRIIQIRGGIVEDSAPIGAPIGTIVTAEGLFYSVPARKKFLKSAQTEFRHITDIVAQFALNYPNIHFILKHNKKIILDLPPKESVTDRVKFLLGTPIFEELLPLSHEDGVYRIRGYIGKPQIASKQQKQYLYLNDRHISDRMLSLAVKEAFGTLLPASYTPVFLLSITAPHETVDVNVHPRKETVAFADPKQLFETIKQGVTKTLQENNITFQLAKFREEHSAKLGDTHSPAGKLLRSSVLSWNKKDPIQQGGKTILEQVHNTYIFTVTEDEVIFVDQHAAHERILYEQFRKEFTEKKRTLHTLSAPITLQFSVSDAQVIEEHIALFHDLGFHLDPFQGNSYLLRRIPSVFSGRKYERIISDMITDLKEGKSIAAIDEKSRRMLAFLSCRAAVQAGDVLNADVMKNLLEELKKTPDRTTCPHGRPTTVTIPIDSLHKAFRR